jgi:hypothetical protein
VRAHRLTVRVIRTEMVVVRLVRLRPRFTPLPVRSVRWIGSVDAKRRSVFGGWHRFEIFEILRKLILISMLTAVAPNSIAYFNVALAVSFVAFAIFSHLKPSAEPSADRIQMCALLVTWLTIFYGLVSASTKYGLPDTAERVGERSVQVRWRLALAFARVASRPPQSQGVRSAGGLACDDQHRRRADAPRRDPALEEAQTS